jgi:crossover junction endodeoxyribonuclease RuvC
LHRFKTARQCTVIQRTGLCVSLCSGRHTPKYSYIAKHLRCGKLLPMRVFGIDCGTEVTGFGVVESCETGRESRLECKALGGIRLAKSKTLPVRLEQVFRELSEAIAQWQPDVVAIEEVFYSVNAKSALKLGQVRGVALLAAACQGLPVAEYAPLKIKSSVVGYGLASKEQVQYMVQRLLALKELPEPADAADALAIAICNIHTAQTLERQGARP